MSERSEFIRQMEMSRVLAPSSARKDQPSNTPFSCQSIHHTPSPCQSVHHTPSQDQCVLIIPLVTNPLNSTLFPILPIFNPFKSNLSIQLIIQPFLIHLSIQPINQSNPSINPTRQVYYEVEVAVTTTTVKTPRLRGGCSVPYDGIGRRLRTLRNTHCIPIQVRPPPVAL